MKLYLLLFFTYIATISLVCAESSFTLKAPAAIIIDAKTGVVLFEKNADKKYYPASITKIVTAMLAVKLGNPKDPITVSKKAAYSIERGSSSIALKPNEKIVLEDAIYGLLLRSANECGNVIAEYLKGSNKEFAVLMNETAKELGCTNSNFVNPHGLHNKKHIVTARDMAIISRHAMTYPYFRKIVKTRFYPFPDTNKHKHEERGDLRNKNKFLHPKSKNYYKYCNGIKSGYTTKALHTFVTSANNGKHEVIVCVLNMKNKKLMYAEIKKAFEFGFKQFSKRYLIEKDFKVKKISLPKADKQVSLISEMGLQKELPTYLNNKQIKKEIVVRQNITLPVSKDQILGHINFTYNNIDLGQVNLISEYEVVHKMSWQNLKKIFISIPFLIGTAVFICIIILLIPIPFDRKRNRHY